MTQALSPQAVGHDSLAQQKKAFTKFKNYLLTKESLNDSECFTIPLGTVDSVFWSEIAEKQPYDRKTNEKLTYRERGDIILERLAIEPSPARFIELLQAIDKTLFEFSLMPDRFEPVDMTYRFIDQVYVAIDISGIKAVEIIESVDRLSNKSYWDILYTGENFCEAESYEILEKGFVSSTVEEAKKRPQEIKVRKLPFYKKINWNNPWLVTIVGGIVVGIFLLLIGL